MHSFRDNFGRVHSQLFGDMLHRSSPRILRFLTLGRLSVVWDVGPAEPIATEVEVNAAPFEI